MKEIDEVNRLTDLPSMLKKHTSQHRKYWGHNPNPLAPDSIVINKGNPKRELARKVHIVLDTNKKIRMQVEKQEMLEKLKRLKRMH